LQAEFNLITKGEEEAAHKIADTTNPEMEDRVFQIASKVALRFAAMHWSNFHTWEFFRNIHTEEEARQQAPRF
jgi:hypothetical protein